jgi:hypothetical protein
MTSMSSSASSIARATFYMHTQLQQYSSTFAAPIVVRFVGWARKALPMVSHILTGCSYASITTLSTYSHPLFELSLINNLDSQLFSFSTCAKNGHYAIYAICYSLQELSHVHLSSRTVPYRMLNITMVWFLVLYGEAIKVCNQPYLSEKSPRLTMTRQCPNPSRSSRPEGQLP